MKCCIGMNCLDGPDSLKFCCYDVSEQKEYEFCARHGLAVEVLLGVGEPVKDAVRLVQNIEKIPNPHTPNATTLLVR